MEHLGIDQMTWHFACDLGFALMPMRHQREITVFFPRRTSPEGKLTRLQPARCRQTLQTGSGPERRLVSFVTLLYRAAAPR